MGGHSMSTIGYYNYYGNTSRYSPAEPIDRYQQMVDRYNGTELHSSNDDPYSEENLATRSLDEQLTDMAASVRAKCSTEQAVHSYLSRKYFGTDDFAYTKQWDDPATYAMYEDDYNAVCFGTIGSGNFKDPRLHYTAKKASEEDAENKKASQKIISHQFANLLEANGISLDGNDILQISTDPYSYQTTVSGQVKNEFRDKLNDLLNTKSNSLQLFLWGIGSSTSGSVNKDSLTKWRAYQNVKQYTGLSLSGLAIKNGLFVTDSGADLMDQVCQGIWNDNSLNPIYRGAAAGYVSDLLKTVAAKGWNTMPDIKMQVAYSKNYGFYFPGLSLQG